MNNYEAAMENSKPSPSPPEHDNDKDAKPSTVVARHDMTISDFRRNITCSPYDSTYPFFSVTAPPVNGLICCTRGSSIAVCNPTTREMMILPDVRAGGRITHARLGYDPVGDRYKVLCAMIGGTDMEPKHLVMTLIRCEYRWRKITDTNGEPYTEVEFASMIARFDIRTEKMTFIQAPTDDITSWTFVNHHGKFGGVEYGYSKETRVWIQEKRELWNQTTCVLPCEWDDLFREKRPSYSPGEIHTGEVMLCSHRLESSKPLSVFYSDVIQESLRSAQVEGIADYEFRRVNGIGEHSSKGEKTKLQRMERVMNIIKPKPDPKQLLRDWQRKLRQECRNIERQIRDIQKEERTVQKAIKEAAKRNDMVSAKALAKEIVSSRRTVNRLYENKAQMNSISMHLGESVAVARTVGHLSKSAEVMKLVNNLMKAPQMAATMQEFSKEMTKAGVIEEFVNDAIDNALDSEDMEEEIDEEVDKVLTAIAGETAAELPETVRKERIKVPAQKASTSREEEAIAEGVDDEEELEEIRARLAKWLKTTHIPKGLVILTEAT
ncbi:unnamed protein product [Thlaspi arvense]|uniref:F-box associated beta-propeller type 3 domain-containing protein n=1 Tax=Thlaspi arvense TaxID=13288 RepID=A0AAU9SXR1_THLAR|nr:unnamed protein product [Thlaspi arvense]